MPQRRDNLIPVAIAADGAGVGRIPFRRAGRLRYRIQIPVGEDLAVPQGGRVAAVAWRRPVFFACDVGERQARDRGYCRILPVHPESAGAKLRRVAGKPSGLERFAVVERVSANARHLFRDDNALQLAAAFKGRFADLLQATRKRSVLQAAAALEGRTFNRPQAIRQRNMLQTDTILEGGTIDTPYAIRQRNAFQIGAPPESFTRDFGHTRRDHNTLQAAAVSKYIVAKVCETIRQRDLLQAAAAHKCRSDDSRYAIRDRNVR